MDFSATHHNFQLSEEPDNAGYSYSSSSESDSACSIYTPNYPSPPLHSTVSYDVSMYHRGYEQNAQHHAWTCAEAYYDRPSLEPSSIYAPNPTFSSGLPLHAPIPLPSHSGVLFSGTEVSCFSAPSSDSPRQPFVPFNHAAEANLNSMCQPQGNFTQPDCHAYVPPSTQNTFLTPSELLGELTAHDTGVTDVYSESMSEKKSETARRARRRAVADSVGFIPTDPDSISSHEKKRHYLECLEHYVMYLHEQFSLVGVKPVPLERVSSYRGLSSRSIRTLLVHMENITRKLNLQTLSEEQMFIRLRDTVFKQETSNVAAVRGYQRRAIPLPAAPAGNTSTRYSTQL